MQVKVLGAERRRRWSYDEKVRLIEETLQAGETVCGVARRLTFMSLIWRRVVQDKRLKLPGIIAFTWGARLRFGRCRIDLDDRSDDTPCYNRNKNPPTLGAGGSCR
ncbi:transposase [Bradyrhizobium sp. WSM471]|uniref:transposase n=1 Tax=Bradyrhizobium sp. WSM471 TaxID=319017 RepID=UPI000683DAE8